MTPPCAEARIAYTNDAPTGAGAPKWSVRIYQARATSEYSKELDRLHMVDEAAGLLDDLDFSVDDLIESRKEAARHGW